MQVGNGEAIVDMLKDFGLTRYEARMYFSLLTLGEAKVTTVTRKAAVPQSKAYDVLDRLTMKGFVELSRQERPKQYRAKDLKNMATKAIAKEEKQIRRLYNSYEMLQRFVQSVSTFSTNGELRLFSPSYQRTCLQTKGGDIDG